MWMRNRQIKILFLILVCLFAYTTWTVYSSKSKLSNDDFIRFHVIAHSNSEEDQNLKLKVRDGILAKINSELVQEAMARHHMEQTAELAVARWEDGVEGEADKAGLNLEESRQYIRDHLQEIEETAERIIRENGYDYTAKADLGVKWIPEKTYGQVTFPAGNYEALNITIGSGKGENWWCVLFPPLCLIGITPEEQEQMTEDVQEIYKDVLMDKKYDPLKTDGKEQTTLKLKFKTLEVIEDLKK